MEFDVCIYFMHYRIIGSNQVNGGMYLCIDFISYAIRIFLLSHQNENVYSLCHHIKYYIEEKNRTIVIFNCS